MRTFDLVIIGCGQGADPLACAFAGAGKSVALIERGALGGSCVNWGCTPTKTLHVSAKTAYDARRAAEVGVETGPVTVDFGTVMRRKEVIIGDFRSELEEELKGTEGLEILHAEARFTGPRRLQVGDEEIEGGIVVIDTGTRPQIPDLPGLKDVPFLTAAELLDLRELPGHLIVLGGGYIGLEFGQSFRRFGSEVTIVEKGDRLLSREDEDVTDAVQEFLEEEGITVECEADIQGVAREGDEIVLTLAGKTLRGTHLLVATSQTPNTEGLDLDKAGIETDERGFVKVDSKLRTNIEGVYAIGDVKGGPAFTPISYDDYRVLHTNLLEGGDRTIEGRPVPYCVFVDPQLARVGLSESEAKEKEIPYRIGRIEMTDLGYPIEKNRPKGFIKALVAEDDTILGVAVLGIDAGDQMAFFQIAMMGGLKHGQLTDGIYAHPTLAEGLNKVFRDLKSPA